METNRVNQELADLLQKSKQVLQEYCAANGKTYSLDQWVTIKEYCKRFGIENTQTVSNWIESGIIPEENMVLIPDYNDIRLIKAVPYHDV